MLREREACRDWTARAAGDTLLHELEGDRMHQAAAGLMNCHGYLLS